MVEKMSLTSAALTAALPFAAASRRGTSHLRCVSSRALKYLRENQGDRGSREGILDEEHA